MNKKSCQRWAVGAITLAVLIACSPKPEDPAVATTPAATIEPPSAETTAIKVPPGAVVVPTAPASEPGYSGVWAPASADCVDSTKVYALSGGMLKLAPQARACSVNSLQEEHPTGRSMIYHIMAGCVADPATGTTSAGTGADEVTLTFGASDTVMKMKVNADPEMTLERCPAAPTP